ncbi:helix-turn-helix transcriptional regulator [Nitrosomonas supralitoralis]|uniref:Transcriptional regulator n=1 Tax=Nitrosomonas supralitoralis TaxID=2116706 RepID=A0A2P7NZA8_9PROT|nr:WYL domain-containing protein [Nitrosomonas supralitoralis]PSJ18813.1 transcriptional regulator [Nitrosomonas supralitoralis]
MNSFQRIYQLHRILASRRLPISHKNLEQLLECSRATVNRTIEALRSYYNAPLIYDRERNGYHYDATSNDVFELPGIWFDAQELYALLTAQQLLEQIQPGLLDAQLKPIKDRLERILTAQNLNKQEITSRIRILSMMGRNAATQYFQQAASALLQRKQLRITYHSRSHDQQTKRVISPQRLTHYRDNWYLDAWCHKRDALRSFAVERITSAALLEYAALEITEIELNEHFSTSYGIFSGKARQTAILHFTAERSRWVAEEQWHPQQEGKFLPDGRYELCIPYANETELVMDILKHGAAVEVITPKTLRQTIIENLRKMQTIYNQKK